MRYKKAVALVLTAALGVSCFSVSTAAKSKVKLSSKNVNVIVGKTKTVELKGAKKKVKWSVTKKGIITLTKKKNGKAVKIKGKKTGKTVLKAKYSGKYYRCTVKVTKKTGGTGGVTPTDTPSVGSSTKPIESPVNSASATKKTEESKQPVSTNTPDPGSSKAPEGTPDLGSSKAPEGTPDSGSSEAPAGTPDSGSSEAPAGTPDLGSSKAPEGTPDLGSSEEPEGTPDLGSSEAPEDTSGPESSVAPSQAPSSADIKDLSPGFYTSEKVLVSTWEDAGVKVETDYTEDDMLVNDSGGFNSSVSYFVKEYNEEAYAVSNRIKIIVLPTGISHIGDYSFYNCEVETVVIPDTVESIGNYAFGNTSLTSFEMPDSVTSVGEGSFINCQYMETLTVSDHLASIGNNAFYSSGIHSVHIPASLGELTVGAFGNCQEMTEVEFDEESGISTIPGSCFSYCKSLESLTLPTGVTIIGEKAFSYCGSLKSIQVNEVLEEIGNNAFEYSGLETFTAPSVKKAGISIFDSCSDLTKVVLSDELQASSFYTNRLPRDMFRNCTSLVTFGQEEGVVTIPKSIRETDSGCFAGCESITCVKALFDLCTIGEECFDGCSLLECVLLNTSDEMTYEEWYAQENDLPVASDKLRTIKERAFNDCVKLRVLGRLKELSNYTLSTGSRLNLTYTYFDIERNAFNNCTSIMAVYFGDKGAKLAGYRLSQERYEEYYPFTGCSAEIAFWYKDKVYEDITYEVAVEMGNAVDEAY